MVRFQDLDTGQTFVHAMDESSDDSAYVLKKTSASEACYFDSFGNGEIVWGTEPVSIDLDRRVQPLAFERVS